MTDKEKSKKQLISELVESRARIADLEEADRALRNRINTLMESAEKYRLVADNTYDWEFWLSPAAEFIYTSSACERITGYTSEAFAGDPMLLFRIIHPDDFASVSDNLHRKRAEIGVCEIEFRIIRRDGEERWIALAFQPVYNENGLYLGIRGSNRDVTDRKRMELELLRNQKYEAIGILAGGIAHDFNNMLTALLGNASLAIWLVKHDKHEEAVEKLENLETICQQAKDLTRRLLQFSQGGISEKRLTSLARPLRQGVASLFYGSDMITCSIALPDDLWPAILDEGQIGQVVRHLLMNARDAMPEGGAIDIHAENLQVGSYGRLPLKPGRYVKWSIHDQGLGIPEEHLSRVFDPYFTTKTIGNIKGMGLGLAICYAVIMEHGGFIEIESTVGKGTTVSVYLPAGPAPDDGGEEKKTNNHA